MSLVMLGLLVVGGLILAILIPLVFRGRSGGSGDSGGDSFGGDGGGDGGSDGGGGGD